MQAKTATLRYRVPLALMVLLGIARQAQAQNPQPPAPLPPPTGASVPTASATDTSAKSPEAGMIFSGYMDPFDYNPQGRPDPFVQPIPERPMQQGSLHGPLLPLQRFELSQLTLIGIIWDVRHPKAMIKDSANQVHVVGPNTKVGPRNGYIAAIREGEIVVVETDEQDGQLVSTAQVVKIAK